MIKTNLIWTGRMGKLVEISSNFEKYIEDNEINIYCVHDLENFFRDYVRFNYDNNFLFNYLSEKEQDDFNDDLEAEILNMDELVEKYSYLIKTSEISKAYNCCSQYTTNYCPECGNQL